MSPQRIMIFGRSGAGKTIFARALGKKLNIPVYHLDKYFYTHNWQQRNTEEFMNIQYNLTSRPAWIIDGNATRSFLVRYSEADTAIYFKYNRLLCLWRIFKRWFIADQSIGDKAEGCPEKLDWNLVKYMWTFDERVQKEIPFLQEQFPDVKYYVVTDDRQAQELLKNFTEEK